MVQKLGRYWTHIGTLVHVIIEDLHWLQPCARTIALYPVHGRLVGAHACVIETNCLNVRL